MAQYSISEYGTDTYGLGGGKTVDPGASPFIGQQFNVTEPVSNVGAPTIRTVFNQFDEFGLLSNLKRLRGEPNWAYKRRISDVFIHLANSTYRGLINGITRELGLSFFYPISISPKLSPLTGARFAHDPYIKLDGIWMYLYSDFANGVVDLKLDRFQAGGNCETFERLAECINDNSNFFTASAVSGADEFNKSMTIINQSSRIKVESEPLNPSTSFNLEFDDLVDNSATFSDVRAYRLRRAVSVDVNIPGEFHVDLSSGVVTAGSMAIAGATVDYEYNTFPFKPIASPVILHDINNENFRSKMFEQVLQDDGTVAHGLPTEVGVDIINELISVTPMYWGI